MILPNKSLCPLVAITMDWPLLSGTVQSQSFFNPYFFTKYGSILQRSLIFELIIHD